MKYMVLMA